MSCSRRVVLKTIGVGCLASACGGGDEPAPMGVFTMCGTDMCISIAENPELADVGGSLIFVPPAHRIYVVHTASGFATVTAVCTHAQCVINFNGSSGFDCPCHGSKFSIDGSVTKGPAFRPLRVYTNTLVGDTLTVKLA